MRIAIIMLSFNRLKYLKRVLNRLEQQIGNKTNFDIFIYDNGSSDKSPTFLKNYSGKLNLDITLGKKNLGTTRATKFLFKEKCFGKGYDFIVKTDDDILLPNGWQEILKYWNHIEKENAAFVSFIIKGEMDYFEGCNWIGRNPINLKQVHLGPFHCYRADLGPSFQISTEKWWQAVLPKIKDHGCLYGAWDYSLMRALVEIKKYFFLVCNHEMIHIQKDEDFPNYSKLKEREFKKIRKKLKDIDWEKRDALAARLHLIKEMKKQGSSTPRLDAILKRGEMLINILEHAET